MIQKERNQYRCKHQDAFRLMLNVKSHNDLHRSTVNFIGLEVYVIAKKFKDHSAFLLFVLSQLDVTDPHKHVCETLGTEYMFVDICNLTYQFENLCRNREVNTACKISGGRLFAVITVLFNATTFEWPT